MNISKKLSNITFTFLSFTFNKTPFIMPKNFFKVLLIWLVVEFIVSFLISQVNIYYSNKLSDGVYSMSDLGSILIVLGFFSLVIKGLTLGLGLRHLVRSNNHKVSLGAIFSFVGAFIIIPFIISTALTFYYYKSGYYEGTTDSFDIQQLYLVAATNFVISLMMVLITFTVAGQWRIFRKAERNGWKFISSNFKYGRDNSNCKETNKLGIFSFYSFHQYHRVYIVIISSCKDI